MIYTINGCVKITTTINVVFSSKPCLMNRSEVVGVSVHLWLICPRRDDEHDREAKFPTLLDMEKQSSIYIYIHTRILVYIYMI